MTSVASNRFNIEQCYICLLPSVREVCEPPNHFWYYRSQNGKSLNYSFLATCPKHSKHNRRTDTGIPIGHLTEWGWVQSSKCTINQMICKEAEYQKAMNEILHRAGKKL